MVQRAGMLGMSRGSDFADWTDVPLTVDVDMSKVVAFKASFTVVGMGTRKGCIHGYSMDGSRGAGFMTKFHVLDSELSFRGEGRRGCGRGNLQVSGCS